jgi:hypothetical protein
VGRLINRIKKRRANLSPEKKEKRRKIFRGIGAVASRLPVVGVVAEVAEVAATAGVAIKRGGGANSKNIMAASKDTLEAALTAVVGDSDVPEVDDEVASAIGHPVTMMAMQAAQEIIDKIEERTGMDIPEFLEEEIIEVVMDVVDDLAEERSGPVRTYIVGTI